MLSVLDASSFIPVDRSSFGGCCVRCRSWSGSYGSRASFCPHHVSARAEHISLTRDAAILISVTLFDIASFKSARKSFSFMQAARDNTLGHRVTPPPPTSLSIRAFVKRASGTTSLVRHFSCSVASPLKTPLQPSPPHDSRAVPLHSPGHTGPLAHPLAD